MSQSITFVYENSQFDAEIKYAAQLLFELFDVNLEFISLDRLAPEQTISVFYGNESNYASISPALFIQESSFFTKHYLNKTIPEIKQNGDPNSLVLFSPDDLVMNKKSNTIFINQDIIASTFFWASRYEELCVSTKDSHNRFTANQSIALQNNVLSVPIVDNYTDMIKTWLQLSGIKLFPKSRYEDYDFIICPTHDIDTLTKGRYEAIYHELKHFKSNPARSMRNLIYLTATLFNRDIYWNFKQILDIERKHNATSTFYFLPKTEYKVDADYDLKNKAFQHVFKSILEGNSEIGLHASYNSLYEKNAILDQKQELEKSAQIKLKSIRHHFLRFDVESVWDVHVKSGFEIDTSLGFAEYPGFRAGLARPFHPFNFNTRSRYNILEIPLIIMDGTFSHYLKESPETAWDHVLPILEQVKKHRGIASVLWHNTLFTKYKYPGFKELFEQILTWVNENNGKCMSIKEAEQIWNT